MKKFVLFMATIFITGLLGVRAQSDDIQNVILDSSTNGTTVIKTSDLLVLRNELNTDGEYNQGYDYRITIEPTCDSVDSNGVHLYACFTLTENAFDVGCMDTLYLYDGPSITSPLLLKRNNCYASEGGIRFYASPTNTTGKLTVRFRSTFHDSTEHYTGWAGTFSCEKPCENVTPIIDSVFDRVDLATDSIVGQGIIHLIPERVDTIFYYEYYSRTVYDTIYEYDTVDGGVGVIDSHMVINTHTELDSIQTDSIIRFDTTNMIMAALLCQGQAVIFHGHGEYTHNTGYYNPTDLASRFLWDFSMDSLYRLGATSARYAGFQDPGCYEVYLNIIDENGCKSKSPAHIQARVAQNPVKTIFDLSNICNNERLKVNVSYDGENGTFILRKITFQKVVKKTYPTRQFIPDGPCNGNRCYEAPVTFTEFGAKKVTSAKDICSVCINYEHSYMGDYRIAIRCPIYDENVSLEIGEGVLKYGKNCPPPPATDQTCDPTAPADSPEKDNYAGGGKFTGYALDNSWSDNRPVCDPTINPYGVGLDYCWSRNKDYTLITGDAANVPERCQPGNWYISSHGTYPPPPVDHTIPNGFPHAGETITLSNATMPPSDHENKTDYYSPSSDFTSLIGCPLDGEWKAVICDFWGADNGWIFSWSLDICGSNDGGCDYQVPLDSVVWEPYINPETDYNIYGEYKGLQIERDAYDINTAYISSPDTAGDFKVLLHIYDNFGCRWDTATHISTVYTPLPNLGNDTSLCDVATMILDASDRHSNKANYQYTWNPYGETTPQIVTTPNVGTDVTYIVEVNNIEKNRNCTSRDTIHIKVNPQPVPNFDPGLYPLEGCEPMTIHFANTSKNGDRYRWMFGDGTYSTQKDPTHSYAAGSYDLKYYIESDKGCKDSLIYPGLITVHPNPHASFSWDPVFPTVLHPSVSLINKTEPDDGSTLYFWEIEYSKHNPGSYHTITEANPSWEWAAQDGEDVSGSYNVRLIARTDNYGPSGNLIQCGDSVENTIIIINDNLMFPNVLTPNGDGVNDIFIISNLIEGGAYPINTLDVYDKWGSRIYHAENISSYDQFWDPVRTNTPAGTYFYRFSGKGYQGNIEHNGVIEILK